MTASKRALRAAVWCAAGGFAFGWVSRGLAIPPPKIVDPPEPMVAVAPQNLPMKAPEGGVVLDDGRIVTPLKAVDPSSLVISPGDPCADAGRRPRRK